MAAVRARSFTERVLRRYRPLLRSWITTVCAWGRRLVAPGAAEIGAQTDCPTVGSDSAYAVDLTDRRIPVSHDHEQSPQERVPSPDEQTVPELEDDQTIAPRPEEDIADVLRAKPDVEDHSRHLE